MFQARHPASPDPSARIHTGSNASCSQADDPSAALRDTQAARFGGLDELDPPRGEHAHLQQEPAMAPALDVGLAVGPFPIADRQFDDLETELGRPEQQVEVTERIEVAEV